MNHKAIYKAYPNVVRIDDGDASVVAIDGSETGVECYDKFGSRVAINKAKVFSVQEKIDAETEAKEELKGYEDVRNTAWAEQVFEARAGVVITVRPPQTGKQDYTILNGFLFNLQNGISTYEYVTDIHGIRHKCNEAEIKAALASGIKQSKDNYNEWYSKVTN